ncbi:MAG: phosphate-starvation-inducible PsiE family protein [Tolypothrix brevis GSE-NOS-MK-07-07A]|nr:phosphate-starvation-inducible PsiE family protein [Tolypothrix brevis GSE-NOS-MK-07-07A]
MWKLFRQFKEASKDDNFMHYIESIEVVVSKVLSLAMVVVILVAIFDLGVLLIKELFTTEYGAINKTLFKIFGLFLNILIALEILENITAYLKKHVVQVELVIVTSLIAVSRKIIILDLEKTDGVEVIGLGIAIFALSISYWIIRYSNSKSKS